MEHTKPTRTKRRKVQQLTFEVPVNGRIYEVSATPFAVPAGDTFFRVSYNNGPVHVFGWDEGLGRFAETDTTADIIPPVIEMSIAKELKDNMHQLQEAA